MEKVQSDEPRVQISIYHRISMTDYDNENRGYCGGSLIVKSSRQRESSEKEEPDMEQSAFRVHGVRYQSRDVNRAVAFYTQHLGFELNICEVGF